MQAKRELIQEKNNMQEKEIIITNLSSKTITPKPGASWKAFTVYQVQGNDGLTYETTDREYFDTLKLGEKAKIKFSTKTKNSNGKIYTSYKIELPKKVDPAVGELKKEILDRMDAMEKNIIAAIKLVMKPAAPVAPIKEEDPNQLSLFPDDDRSAYAEGDDDDIDNY